MLTESITLPLWLLSLVLLLAAWAALDRLLLPGLRWLLRRSTNRVLDELRARLQIEIQPFQRTKREVLIDRLLYDPQVQQAAEAYSERHDMPRELVMRRAERYVREIVPAFNAYLYFRIGYWLGRRIAETLYRVRTGHIDAALEQVPSDATVVFVMNHRSNMDYILVAYLAADRTALSYAVGEWARVWPLQTLFHAMGAYFVRRDSRNPLYRRVLERYVSMATGAGVTQAIYPEGGLSRDGRLREPKLGLLDYMLRGFDPGQRDLVFVPVAINYDRTLEDRTLLPGPEPQRRSLWRAALTTTRFAGHNLWLMLQSRWYRFGYACVNFGAPLSLRDFIAEQHLDLATADKERRFAAVAELGERLMSAVAEVIPVLPVSLVATVFADAPGERFSELALKARVFALMNDFRRAGAKLYVPRGDDDYLVTAGLRMLTLRCLVERDGGLLSANLQELSLLRYYANAVAHLRPVDESLSLNLGNAYHHKAKSQFRDRL